jgi:hypothetical protein
MSFDKDNTSPTPMVNVHKRTTKVNLGVVIGVVFFFLLAGATILRVMRDPPQTPPGDNVPTPATTP